MATTPKTVKTYALNGTLKDFAIPFEYLARKFVVVTLIGVDRKVLVLNTDYRFSTPTQITTTIAWGTGQGYDLIEIRRVTSATERLVDFADGSILRAYDLNTAQVQSLHIAEEARDLTADTIGVNNDGNLDARARKIVNLADGVDDGDAVNMRQQRTWGGSAQNQAAAAATSATAASNSASAASSSATAASSSASSALASKNAAATSEANAATSATNASNSASAAATSASQAATSKANAATSEANAASSASSAQASKNAAALSESNAATSASSASSSATSATNSKNAAATSETNAAASATSATNSKNAAATSEANAASSASAALASKNAAATSETNAAASFTNFDKRYLGQKASDPTVDNQGAALSAGALYFNTTVNEMRVYFGGSWVTAYINTGNTFLKSNNLSDILNLDTALTNLLAGNSRRIKGNMSPGAGSFAQSLFFQSSTVNGQTQLRVMPNGTSLVSGLQLWSNSADLENSARGALTMDGSAVVLAADKLGTGSYLPVSIYTSGAERLRVNVDGRVDVKSDFAPYYGYLQLSSADGTSYKRLIRLNNGSHIEFVNKANTAITHTFNDNGYTTFLGDLTLSNGSNEMHITCGPWGGYMYGNSTATGFYKASAHCQMTNDVGHWVTLTGRLRAQTGTSGGYADLYRTKDGSNNKSAWIVETESGMGAAVSHFPTVGSHFSCNADAAMNLGWSLTRWNTLWASTGTIQTSDAREKTPVRPFNDAELSVAKVLAKDIGIYQWLKSIEEKGAEGARLFCGQTVQRIIEQFTDAGLDWHRYSFICQDIIPSNPPTYDEEGNMTDPGWEASDRYSLRYDGLSMFIMRGLAENQRLLEERLAALEAKL